MKIVPMDIETTGTDCDNDQVLEIALVIEDTGAEELLPIEELPHWVGRIKYDRVVGHPAALVMNAGLLADLARAIKGGPTEGPEWYRSLQEACQDALDFLDEEYGHVVGDLTKPPTFVAAGKNVAGFDMRFMPGFFQRRFAHRVIDAGSVALGGENHWWKKDRPPGLGDLIDHEVAHDALTDARDVIRALRMTTGRYGRVGDD
jgi:oligoribonuclease (3'-5' exoribonuclease)